jgi:hypothetical protein
MIPSAKVIRALNEAAQPSVHSAVGLADVPSGDNQFVVGQVELLIAGHAERRRLERLVLPR